MALWAWGLSGEGDFGAGVGGAVGAWGEEAAVEDGGADDDGLLVGGRDVIGAVEVFPVAEGDVGGGAVDELAGDAKAEGLVAVGWSVGGEVVVGVVEDGDEEEVAQVGQAVEGVLGAAGGTSGSGHGGSPTGSVAGIAIGRNAPGGPGGCENWRGLSPTDTRMAKGADRGWGHKGAIIGDRGLSSAIRCYTLAPWQTSATAPPIRGKI